MSLLCRGKLPLNLPYVGLDFVLGRDGRLYFLEANSVAAGIYYAELVSRRAAELMPELSPELKGSLTLVRDFVGMCSEYHRILRGRPMRTVAITVPERWKSYLARERKRLLEEFRATGVEAFFLKESSSEVRDSLLVATVGGREVIPDLIVRRTYKFPREVSQPVVTPSRAGKITGSKWKSYKALRKFIEIHPDATNWIALPETVLAKTPRRAKAVAERFLEDGKTVVIKPSRGCGGKGIVFIERRSELDSLPSQEDYWPAVVQEDVDVLPLLGYDGRPYRFDIRVYAYLGELAGGQIRRCSSPTDSGLADPNKYKVANVSSGGAIAPLLMGGSRLEEVYLPPGELRFKDRVITVEGASLRLGREISERLRLAVWLVVEALDSEIDRLSLP